jgi:hypothetical protein
MGTSPTDVPPRARTGSGVAGLFPTVGSSDLNVSTVPDRDVTMRAMPSFPDFAALRSAEFSSGSLDELSGARRGSILPEASPQSGPVRAVTTPLGDFGRNHSAVGLPLLEELPQDVSQHRHRRRSLFQGVIVFCCCWAALWQENTESDTEAHPSLAHSWLPITETGRVVVFSWVLSEWYLPVTHDLPSDLGPTAEGKPTAEDIGLAVMYAVEEAGMPDPTGSWVDVDDDSTN